MGVRIFSGLALGPQPGRADRRRSGRSCRVWRSCQPGTSPPGLGRLLAASHRTHSGTNLAEGHARSPQCFYGREADGLLRGMPHVDRGCWHNEEGPLRKIKRIERRLVLVVLKGEHVNIRMALYVREKLIRIRVPRPRGPDGECRPG